MEGEKTEEIEKGIPIPVHLRSVGEAPSLKKAKFKIDGLKPIAEVSFSFSHSFSLSPLSLPHTNT
jgi:hypothetical protein